MAVLRHDPGPDRRDQKGHLSGAKRWTNWATRSKSPWPAGRSAAPTTPPSSTTPSSCPTRRRSWASGTKPSRSKTSVGNRKKWPATWFEEDWGLAQPQLDIGRIWSDAHAALKKGGHGLIAKHWRTRILSPNAGAMSNLTWAYGTTDEPPKRTLPANKNDWIDALLQAVGSHPVRPRGGRLKPG